jgi:hypothetical protein
MINGGGGFCKKVEKNNYKDELNQYLNQEILDKYLPKYLKKNINDNKKNINNKKKSKKLPEEIKDIREMERYIYKRNDNDIKFSQVNSSYKPKKIKRDNSNNSFNNFI